MNTTGDEIVAPGEPIRPGAVYDSNAAILAAAVEEAGGCAKPLGIGTEPAHSGLNARRGLRAVRAQTAKIADSMAVVM